MNFVHVREFREVLHDIFDLCSFDILIFKLVCSCSFFKIYFIMYVY